MKKTLLLITAFVAFLSFSCSSDDDSNSNENINLAGEWQLTNVDFTVFEEGGIPASDGCVIELVSGYEFKDDHTLYVILNEDGFFDPYAQEYWSWSGDINDFEIIQNNPAMPPYNFGLKPTNLEVKEVDGKAQMTFHAKMGNDSEADFTLIKQEIDPSQSAELTKPDGSDYYCGFFDN